MAEVLELSEIDGLVLAARLVDGRPRDLLVRPAGEPDLIEAVVSARILRVDRRAGWVRLDIGEGREAVAPLASPAPPPGQGRLLVQLVGPSDIRDPAKAVEARVAVELRGRALIYRPDALRVRVSRALPAAPDWVGRLPEAGGWTVRRAAAEIPGETALAEADRLAAAWRDAAAAHDRLAPDAPATPLVAAPSLVGLWLAEGVDPERIAVSGDATALRRELARVAPDLADRIEAAGPEPVLAERLPALLGTERTGPSGARITVERTRLGTTIDLDQGSAPDAERANTEGLALAAEAVRLGNRSGRILIDPAGAARGRAAEAVVERVRALFEDDPRRPHLPARLTPSGLVEITRRRLGYSLAEAAALV